MNTPAGPGLGHHCDVWVADRLIVSCSNNGQLIMGTILMLYTLFLVIIYFFLLKKLFGKRMI
jgi:hypothetical protein